VKIGIKEEKTYNDGFQEGYEKSLGSSLMHVPTLSQYLTETRDPQKKCRHLRQAKGLDQVRLEPIRSAR